MKAHGVGFRSWSLGAGQGCAAFLAHQSPVVGAVTWGRHVRLISYDKKSKRCEQVGCSGDESGICLGAGGTDYVSAVGQVSVDNAKSAGVSLPGCGVRFHNVASSSDASAQASE